MNRSVSERQLDGHCVGNEGPCKDLKQATMQAIAYARMKIDAMVVDEVGMFGASGWGAHAADFRGRVDNIAAMIFFGPKLGCDMNAEIAAAAGLSLPSRPL